MWTRAEHPFKRNCSQECGLADHGPLSFAEWLPQGNDVLFFSVNGLSQLFATFSNEEPIQPKAI